MSKETTKLKTIRWDALDYLHSDADLVGYLEAALAEGDSALVTAVLGDIARAKGMTKVAEAAGLGRESLYKALSRSGNPELATVLRVMRALGLRFHVSAADEPSSKPSKRQRSSRR
jgi:probable addiction module antidote protein